MKDKELQLQNLIKLRKAHPEDASFIFNSWLKSFRFSKFSKEISSTIYFTNHHKVIEYLLKSKTTVIACNNEDPTQIFGYANAGLEEGVLVVNYIYVKESFRRLGLGKILLNAFEHSPEAASVFTHKTSIADKLAAKYNMHYHPYLMFPNLDEVIDEEESSEE